MPFFSISGSDFVEMFVGVGASRVRDLFEQAKASAPAIIFMDEIDAVGRHRGAGLGGGHDEREQTLNQLLVEMDGFDTKGGIILIAATNRPDILDPALLRPGRFDRQIVVDRPDLSGRRAILDVHARGKPLAAGVSLEVLARRTPGFTGADLANLLNEAALLAARHDLNRIGMVQLEEAIDRVIAGPERKTLVMSDQEKLITAYHEAGHAIVGHVLPHADPIHKVSIVARSRSLGLDLHPARGQAQPLPQRAARRDGHVPRGPHGRGAQLRRADDGRRERHREGDGDRPGHGDGVRHERAARAPAARPEERRGLPRPRARPPGQLLRAGRGHHRRRGAPPDRRRPRPGPGHPHPAPGDPGPTGRRPGRGRDPRHPRAHGDHRAAGPVGRLRAGRRAGSGRRRRERPRQPRQQQWQPRQQQ